jgi:hypothetical protein
LIPISHSSSQDDDPARNSLSARLRWASGAVRLTLREPGDGLDRALGRVRRLVGGSEATGRQYDADAEWERHLHERLGQAWPCEETREFEELWTEIEQSLARQGLTMGRGAYGGWDDGDRGFARVVWCLARHLPTKAVVETGVARGVTSRVILEALQRSGDGGRLCSIDLPALDTTLHSEIGAAVPDELRSRWTYLNGTSRSRLPALLAELGEIDLFVHDSSHTTRNVRFELERAWGALRKGAIVADDIERNTAFGAFMRAHPDASAFIAAADDSGAQFGILLKGF